ncbi:hypothetical protein TRVL_10225 [Trypanosoma vivax]|nr:hypothetical protein TRVL_10225 [Trypanosoma vivax]
MLRKGSNKFVFYSLLPKNFTFPLAHARHLGSGRLTRGPGRTVLNPPQRRCYTCALHTGCNSLENTCADGFFNSHLYFTKVSFPPAIDVVFLSRCVFVPFPLLTSIFVFQLLLSTSQFTFVHLFVCQLFLACASPELYSTGISSPLFILPSVGACLFQLQSFQQHDFLGCEYPESDLQQRMSVSSLMLCVYVCMGEAAL